MTVNISDSTSYYAGKKLKGDGFGTDAGWYVGNINGMLSLSTEFMNLSNICSFDYYIQGFGKFTQSLDGFINLGISFVFRAFLDDNTEFNANMASGDPKTVGKQTGLFIKNLMQVEIPSASLETGGDYELASSLVLSI